MGNIQLQKGDLKVRYGSEEVTLLPKEYQLFRYLYERENRVFSRDELLDAVWAMEAPTDRTVDDHVYRLRKKLTPLSSVFTIETVRGQGYRLKVHKEMHSPLLKDEEVSSNVKTLFHKYHLYGQGDALKLLEENQAVFGFELDLQSKLYLRFMKGEFQSFQTQEDPFWEKCYYLLHIYSYTTRDKKKSLEFFTKALKAKALPEHHRLEIRLLNRLSLLLFTGQHDEAEELLITSKKEVHEKKLEGFIPLIALTESYLALVKKQERSVIQKKIHEMEELLLRYPFSRERASFSILKGVHCLAFGEEAESHFLEGIQLFKEAKYVPGIFISLMTIRYFRDVFQVEALEQFENMWEAYADEYKLSDLEPKIRKLLDDHLSSL
ncbi:winged helix-turn-helix domain-containing protein [Alkalihalobacillus sp. CinArs1]|uniref:winged helix-turn-helix domain-containing protein n=1 Tax=Alkalihalobacillus sp. CinArs1 TaxID=2995314 RepID=UPI0022DDA7B9|nr:winged helix-turn-helix domain-containing protein [Alkalihalobacillus sp. CinArs1]